MQHEWRTMIRVLALLLLSGMTHIAAHADMLTCTSVDGTTTCNCAPGQKCIQSPSTCQCEDASCNPMPCSISPNVNPDDRDGYRYVEVGSALEITCRNVKRGDYYATFTGEVGSGIPDLVTQAACNNITPAFELRLEPNISPAGLVVTQPSPLTPKRNVSGPESIISNDGFIRVTSCSDIVFKVKVGSNFRTCPSNNKGPAVFKKIDLKFRSQ